MQHARSVQLQGLAPAFSHRCRHVRVARGDSHAGKQGSRRSWHASGERSYGWTERRILFRHSCLAGDVEVMSCVGCVGLCMPSTITLASQWQFQHTNYQVLYSKASPQYGHVCSHATLTFGLDTSTLARHESAFLAFLASFCCELCLSGLDTSTYPCFRLSVSCWLVSCTCVVQAECQSLRSPL